LPITCWSRSPADAEPSLGNVSHHEACEIKAFLITPDTQSIDEVDIAASWGFGDASSFSRRFRSRFGVSPSEIFGTTLDQTEDAGVRADSPGARLNRDYTDWLQQASGGAA
jgi:AraC-like DNA-binding protein